MRRDDAASTSVRHHYDVMDMRIGSSVYKTQMAVSSSSEIFHDNICYSMQFSSLFYFEKQNVSLICAY